VAGLIMRSCRNVRAGPAFARVSGVMLLGLMLLGACSAPASDGTPRDRTSVAFSHRVLTF